MNDIIFDYYRGVEAEQYSFYRIPKMLFTDTIFQDLSCEAKVLYGLMLDRMSLSLKNHWMDEEERVYIIFTVNNICDLMNCGTQKAVRLLKELDVKTGIGLIEKKRLGLGKPNVIYVKNFMIKDEEGEKQQTEQKQSRIVEIEELQDKRQKFLNDENHNSGIVKIINQENSESEVQNSENHNSGMMKMENQARKETLLAKAKIIHSMPLYVADKVMNVILLVVVAVTAITILVLAIGVGLEDLHITCQRNRASVQEAEELLAAEDYTGLYDYLHSYEVYGQEEFEKYTERVRLYDDDQAFMRDLFRIQEVLDWPAGQQMRSNWVKYVLLDGKDILEMETDFSYRGLEYEENKEYYDDMKQDVAAALLGTLEMTEEELADLMGMERDSEEMDELIRRIFERKGWDYEED